MSDEKKVTEEELKTVRDLQAAYIKISGELGQLSIQKADLKSQLKQIEESEATTFEHLAKLREQEYQISTQLQEAYGSNTLDLETGAIK